MHSYLDCIPCMFRQALEMARLSGLEESGQRAILCQVAELLPSLPLESSPPELSRRLFHLVTESIGNPDPYLHIRRESNQDAERLYPELKQRVTDSATPLLDAVQVAILGNIIDYGALRSEDIKSKLEGLLAEEQRRLAGEEDAIFNFRSLSERLARAENLLYLGDNAGEIVFDRVLLETLREQYPDLKITYAVRGQPIINDAVKQDALDCGLDAVAEIVSSGSDAPGTLLERCSAEFRKLFADADLIISKGQGNYEALSEQAAPIVYMLVAKCPVIAREIGCEVGDIVLLPPQSA